MCIMVTHVCSATTVTERFLILQSIKYLRQQMFSILDSLLKARASATLFKEDAGWRMQSYTHESYIK